MGSSPVPGTDDTRRQGTTEHARSAVNQGIDRSTTSKRSIPRSRTDTTENDTERPRVTPQITTHPLPAPEVAPSALPADLQFIVDAWTELPDAIKAGVLAMVRATLKRGDGE
jgi:hypothetical protein